CYSNEASIQTPSIVGSSLCRQMAAAARSNDNEKTDPNDGDDAEDDRSMATAASTVKTPLKTLPFSPSMFLKSPPDDSPIAVARALRRAAAASETSAAAATSTDDGQRNEGENFGQGINMSSTPIKRKFQ